MLGQLIVDRLFDEIIKIFTFNEIIRNFVVTRYGIQIVSTVTRHYFKRPYDRIILKHING